MYINSSSGALLVTQGPEITAPTPAGNSRSFNEVLKEANAAPVTNERADALPASIETQTTPRPDDDGAPIEENPESPALPEMSPKARQRFEQLLADIAGSPEWAERWMHMCIDDAQGRPLFTLSCHPPRFVDSGEIYTEEKQGYLLHIASLYEEGRRKLYEAELAKGTPLLEIVEKVFRYNCTLPEDFRRMTAW